ncbi:MAG TPA: HAMP domain-containing sensor histidine kinase [Longimicrobium sp.]|nr:HAMP domain-containing sensor histidine kinase [Longimicrobium sp.]
MDMIQAIKPPGEPRLALAALSAESPPAGQGVAAKTALSFLLAATRTLAASLDVEITLATVARLSLPHLGSWCFVDLREGDHMRRIAVIHPDAGRQRLAQELLSGWPPQRDDPLGVPSVVRTRRSEVVFPVTDEMLVAAARSPENLRILRALEIGSLMTVPLLARDEVLGAITYVIPNHGDSFSAEDLLLAEDLGARCAIAIDNARLFGRAREALIVAEAAQKQAEEANLAKMRFLSTMSHELRTPLNAIGGYADLLESGVRGALTERQLADVRRIQVNGRHLLGLVESVLGYARVAVGRVEFGLQDVPLAGVLLEAEVILAPLAAKKGIVCRGLGPDAGGGLLVYADPDKLLQILVNLVANAVKFTPAGGAIDVTFHAAGPRVEIRVADDGNGIAPENRERIFEPFVQLDDRLDRGAEGTGLGLAISRELAIGMGGGLSVESEPGQGSTFTITLSRGRG